jgi:hypothetical protein
MPLAAKEVPGKQKSATASAGKEIKPIKALSSKRIGRSKAKAA